MNVKQLYQQYLNTPSDIQHHLPLLYSLARGNVVELGTRTGVSTSALLAGVEARGGLVTSIDIDDCSHLFKGHPQWFFRQGDSTDPSLAQWFWEDWEHDDRADLLFIDTIHTYEQVTAELTLWAERCVKPGGRILVHDPETFPGVRKAIEEFCQARGWSVVFVLPCHGMAVVEVPQSP